MKDKIIVTLLLLLVSLGCTKQKSDCERRLQGKWSSPLMTMTYDFSEGRVMREFPMLEPEIYGIEITRCEADHAVYRSPKGDTLIEFIGENKIRGSQAGKIPTEMVRVSDDVSEIARRRSVPSKKKPAGF